MVNACKKYYRTNSWQIEKGPDDWYPSKEVDGHWKEPTEKKRKMNKENEHSAVMGGPECNRDLDTTLVAEVR